MKKLKLLGLLVILSLLAGVTSCKDDRDDDDSNTGGGTSPSIYHMTFTGKVYDENHSALSDVEVTIGDKTTTTSWNGSFIIKGASVPTDRYVVKLSKQGYFDNARIGKSVNNGVASIDAGMFSLSNSNVYNLNLDPNTGGQLDIGSEASLYFPPGVKFVDAQGDEYTGTVMVQAMYNNPTTDDFTRFVPGGDQIGKTETGEEKFLRAFGGLTVKLTDGSGNKIEISASSDSLPRMATEIPLTLLQNAPDSVDKWYNGSDMAYASQKGSGKKNGTKYVAVCEHFSAWTFQQAFDDDATVTGTVLDCNNDPVAGVRVQVGQAYTITDVNGNFSQNVPAGVDGLPVYVASEDYFYQGSDVQTLSALSAGQTQNVSLSVPCQSKVTGRLIDCNGNPTSGYIMLNNSGYIYTQNGSFTVIVDGTNTYLSGEISNGDYVRHINFDNVTYPYDAGDLLLCPPPANSNYVSINDTLTISADDEPYTYVYNGDITISMSHQNGQQYQDISIAIKNYTSPGDYNIDQQNGSTLSIYSGASDYAATSGTITVQGDNGEGKRMWGVISASDTSGNHYEGKFNIIHPTTYTTK